MNKPLISLCHATRERPELMTTSVDLWHENWSGDYAYEHILSHAIDVKLEDTDIRKETNEATRKLVQRPYVRDCYGCPCTAVGGWNRGTVNSNPASKILIQLSDDFLPPPNWDRQIVDGFGGTKALDKPAVLGVSSPHDLEGEYHGDGLQVMAIMTRAYMEQMGYFIYPEFVGLSEDNDITQASALWNCLIPRPDIKIAHHWTGGDADADATYKRQNSGKSIYVGQNVYADRLGALFPAIDLHGGEDLLLPHGVEARDEYIRSLNLATPDIPVAKLVIKYKHRRLRGFGTIRHRPFPAPSPMYSVFANTNNISWTEVRDRLVPLVQKYQMRPWDKGRFFFHGGVFLYNLCMRQMGSTDLMKREDTL